MIVLNIKGHPGELPNIMEKGLECNIFVDHAEYQDDTFVLIVTPAEAFGLRVDYVHRLCVALGRECIPMLNANLPYMVGPGREAYGPFDRTKFKTPLEITA